ncbi:hypothetical protein CBCST_17564 [Clostridium botulinum C str. Stockholm]|nr:hypothetical protein CBCST_17564 [Clostridium botulinum C str. Stockholm]
MGLALKNIIPAEELDRDYIVYPEFNMDKCVGCGRCYISCYDGGHQAIEWDLENRLPVLNEEKCVGCHLCSNVCPIQCINKGKIKFKEGSKERKFYFRIIYIKIQCFMYCIFVYRIYNL